MDEEQVNGVSEAYKYSHLYNFSGANKAGMDGMDKDKQAQIIHEMSKDSAFFKRAAKLDAEADLKVQGMRKILAEVKGTLEEKLRNDVNQMSLELEQKRNFSRICCVLDMDMFFAAVEIRDQPHLKDLPVAVGGMSMISTANYVARKYGVRAAMPGFIAKKLCPQLVFVGMSFDKYQAVSDQVKDIIGEYDPDYTSHSLDEVYFDLEAAAMQAWRNRLTRCNNSSNSDSNSNSSTSTSTSSSDLVQHHEGENDHTHSHAQHTSCHSTATGANATHGTEEEPPDIFTLRAIAVELLQEIRTRITTATNGLTCSAGIANNHFLAKIGADVNKPNGQFELPPTREAVLAFVQALPTRKVGGIGKVTERMLESLLGIKTMAQVGLHLPRLLHVLSPILFQFLLRTGMGIGSHEGQPHRHDATDTAEKKAYLRKSLSCERTFNSKGIHDPAELYAKLHKICQHVADDMQQEDLWAKAVTLKLKNVEFELITRIASSAAYFQSAESIESLAKGLLDELLPVNIRLMGVSVSKFKQPDSVLDPKQRNMLMFLKKEEKGDAVEGQSSCSGELRSSRAVEDNSREIENANKCSAQVGSPGLSPARAVSPSHASAERNTNIIASSFTESTTDTGWRSVSGSSASVRAVTVMDSGLSQTGTGSVGSQAHECPVCGQLVQGMLARFNQHLDRCLGVETPTGTATSSILSSRVCIRAASRPAGSAGKTSHKTPVAAAVGRARRGDQKGSALLAALSAGTNTNGTRNMHTIMDASGDASKGVKRGCGSSVGTFPNNGATSSGKEAKLPRKEALALEITDYFALK